MKEFLEILKFRISVFLGIQNDDWYTVIDEAGAYFKNEYEEKYPVYYAIQYSYKRDKLRLYYSGYNPKGHKMHTLFLKHLNFYNSICLGLTKEEKLNLFKKK